METKYVLPMFYLTKSQMFFSTKICPVDARETLRVTDPVKICAAKLRKECEDFDFLLENSYSDADDLDIV